MSGQRPRLHPGRRADHDIASVSKGFEASTKARFEAAPKGGKLPPLQGVLRRGGELERWSRVERIFAPVEVGEEEPATRIIITNLKLRNARVLQQWNMDAFVKAGGPAARGGAAR